MHFHYKVHRKDSKIKFYKDKDYELIFPEPQYQVEILKGKYRFFVNGDRFKIIFSKFRYAYMPDVFAGSGAKLFKNFADLKKFLNENGYVQVKTEKTN